MQLYFRIVIVDTHYVSQLLTFLMYIGVMTIVNDICKNKLSIGFLSYVIPHSA